MSNGWLSLAPPTQYTDNPQRRTSLKFNEIAAWDYYLQTDQNDSALMINRAFADGAIRYPAGFKVQLPSGVLQLRSPIVLPAVDSVTMEGDGWSTVLQPAPGLNANFDVISTIIPPSQGLAGYVRNYINLRNFIIDCSWMAGLVPGQGNGIHLYGCRYSVIEHVYIQSCPNWAILMDGDSTNYSYDNLIHACIFDICNANVRCTNSEANDIVECRFKWDNSAIVAGQPAFGTQDTAAYHLRLDSGYCYVAGNVFGVGGHSVTAAVICFNNGPCKIIGNRFDQVRCQAISLNGGNHEFIGNALGSPGSASLGNLGIEIGSSNNRIIGNSFDTTAGGANFTYAIGDAGGPFSQNIIADNLLIAGTSGLISINAASTQYRIHHNVPYNPVGLMPSQPAVPASTTPYTNIFGVDCTVYIVGGTVSAISVQGQATGLTATPAMVRVPAGASITLTYSSSPTWKWFGE